MEPNLKFDLKEISKEDLAKASKLLSNTFSGTTKTWQNTFSHWWETNPNWSPVIPRGWCAFSDNNCVGFLGRIPFRYKNTSSHSKDSLVAMGATSFAVTPNFRNTSLGLKLATQFLRAKDTDIYICNGATLESLKLWEMLKMAPLNYSWNSSQYLLPANLKALGAHTGGRYGGFFKKLGGHLGNAGSTSLSWDSVSLFKKEVIYF